MIIKKGSKVGFETNKAVAETLFHFFRVGVCVVAKNFKFFFVRWRLFNYLFYCGACLFKAVSVVNQIIPKQSVQSTKVSSLHGANKVAANILLCTSPCPQSSAFSAYALSKSTGFFAEKLLGLRRTQLFKIPV